MSRAIDDQDNDISSEDNSQDELSDKISLQDLPVEIFLHICSFLDASTLVHRLGLTCKQFFNILHDDSIWKTRISRVWPNSRFPILPPDENDKLFWKLSCVVVERQSFLWKNVEAYENFSLEDGHYGTVDGLLLIDNGRTCISGGRDRSLICWRLKSAEHEEKIQMNQSFGHDGWIRDLTLMHNKIYSCSWDQRVIEWDVSNIDINLVNRIPLFRDKTSALLCISSNSEVNLLATGSWNKTISVLDPRLQEPLVNQYQAHKGPVLKVKMDSQYIVSASEDKHVSIWDQRAGRILQTIRISKDSFPMSMDMLKGTVYIGDSAANIHILDINKEFNIIRTYKTEHTNKISGIRVTPGSIITSSADSTVRISSPTDPPRQFTILQCRHGDIAGMDYMNEVLAVCGEGAVQIWRPKTELVC
ncbi:F-box/WD repeat-containing protein 9 [Microplitis demolitor]|uniref:F-box/WD repeat-containing protein 9 n=1 Tax=Microplitis demolitor TaxID=69319 RepID=UPI0004CDCBEF|nr:F-box/WD repeat-containing protein 9 [Microplitis demolitor]